MTTRILQNLCSLDGLRGEGLASKLNVTQIATERKPVVDFDTERDPEREERPPRSPDEGPRRTTGGSSTTEFTYADPLQSFVDTLRELVTRPVSFFAGIARRGDFLNPLIFALVCAVIAVIIGGLLGILGSLVGIGNRGFGEAIGALVGSIFLTPIFFAVALFIGAGIMHLLVVLIVKPATTGYEATFRVVSYSAVGQLLGWIPLLGPLVAGVVAVVLSIIGIREVHNTTTGKAALVVLIPAAVAATFIVFVIGAAVFLTFFR